MDNEAIKLPVMGRNQIVKYYKKIKPVIKILDTHYYLREFSAHELTNYIYTLDIFNDKTNSLDIEKFEEIMDINTLHKFGYYGLFSPIIGDIISQIPKNVINKVAIFRVVHEPNKWECYNLYKEEFDAGFYVAKVRLYSKRY